MNEADNNGLVFNIQKFSIHDGVGIRTLVFMKGCPLKCVWCSNPESQAFHEEIMFVAKNCTKCGKCTILCPNECIDPENFTIDRDTCVTCGQCTKYCYSNSKKIVGQRMTIDDVIEEIEKDRIFYHNSQGGVTVGGGEPTAQPDFVIELFKECKRLDLDTAIETCGFGDWDIVGKVLTEPNQIFYDIKHMDSAKHKILTGVDNVSILKNAQKVSEMEKDITFRIPLIPGCNDDEENMLNTGRYIESLSAGKKNVKLEILPYHALGADKYKWLGMDYGLNNVRAHINDKVKEYNSMFKTLGCNIVE